MRPLPISVLIPAYNRADRIGKALESVAAQLQQPAEVIVIDDGSADGTAEEAHRRGATVVRHEINQGCAIARNSGLAAATQPWIAMLDSDDEWLPHHLASLWPLRGDHLMLANSALQCAADPKDDRLLGTESNRSRILRDPGSLIHSNPIPNSAAMMRRDAVEDVGGFRPPRVDDLDLWLRLLERGTGLLSPIVGAVYHVHQGQISGGAGANRQMHETVVRRFEQRPWWSEARLEQWRGKVGWNDVRSMVRLRRPLDALRCTAYVAASPHRIHGAFRGGVTRWRLKRRCSGLSELVRAERLPPAKSASPSRSTRSNV